MTEGAIEITSVITQFRESESLLEAVREKLMSIALSEEGAAGARGSLESAAGSLSESVASLRAVVEEIAAVRKASVSALEAAQKFLEGTDLSALRTSVESLPKKLETAIGDRMQQMDEKNASHQKNMIDETRKLSERIDDLAKTAASVKEEQGKYAELLQNYNTMYSRIPPRTRKKMGI
jgi:pyridoxal biosynthesis lyase PdxS